MIVLCTIFSFMSDLVNTMNVGNELDSGLSRLSRHTHIVLTELPTEISFQHHLLDSAQSKTFTVGVDVAVSMGVLQ